jgi:uncharacterized protein with HEPN domain
MIEAAREAIGYVEELRRSDFQAARPLQHSVARCIEIIGEAATRITPEYRAAHADIPWGDVIGMRNRLIHAYFDISLDILWRTAKMELPELLPKLEAMLPRDEQI